MGVLFVVGILTQFVGLTLHIIGLGTPEWSFVPDTDQTYGLWEDCLQGVGCVDIVSYKSKSSELMATEAFALLEMLAGIAELALAILFIVRPIFGKSYSPGVLVVALLTGIFALIFSLIAVIIWGAGIHDPDTQDLGYSFAFCITGGILLALGGILTFVGGKFEEE